MGATISRLARRFLPKTEIRILMVGLDASGKTTMLYKLKLGEIVLTVPTIGFNVETVVYKNTSFTVWDVGGQQKIELKDAILLVFANKQDIPNAMSVSEIADKLWTTYSLNSVAGSNLDYFLRVHSKLFCHFRTWTIRRKTEGTFKVAASSSLPNRLDQNYCTFRGRST